MGAAAVAMQTSVAEMTNPILERLTPALAAVPGVAAIVLGGSRARGTARPHSDTDIGLYYRRGEEPAAARLREALRSLVDDPVAAVVTEVGEWGPWIVGGAWLSIGGKKVDLLYRCVEAVEEVVRACRGGDVRMDYQPGHPHGFCSAIWMGEVALCRPLHDPDGALAALKAMTEPYPDPLRQALIRRFLWEVLFSIENGEIAVARGDQTHVAGCAYRALCCVGQVLFALNRRYLINEKGALDEASGFPVTIPRLDARASTVWQAIGRRDFRDSFDELRAMHGELKALAGNDSPA
jgi:predicted nucleotidyltransferase